MEDDDAVKRRTSLKTESRRAQRSSLYSRPVRPALTTGSISSRSDASRLSS